MESTCGGQEYNALPKLKEYVKRAEGKTSETQAKFEQVGRDHIYMIF